MRLINYIVLHCTAGPQNQKTEDIRAFWKKKGWTKPGYHHEINADGSIETLLPIEEIANGVKGFNAHSIHISYKGGVYPLDHGTPIEMRGKTVDNRTDAQKESQRLLIEKYSKMFPAAIIQGHRDFSVDKNRDGIIEPNEWMKTCPSFSVAAWLREINFKSKLPVQFLTTTGVNIRTGPGIEFPIAAPALTTGVMVRFLGEDGGWTYVSVQGDTIKGYVMKKYLQAA